MHSKVRRQKEKDLEPKAIREMKNKKQPEEEITETKKDKKIKKILLIIALIIILYLGIAIGISTHTLYRFLGLSFLFFLIFL